MADVLRQIGERKPSVAVAEGIDEESLLPWAAYSDEYDPHVWFDVTLWQAAVETVRNTLVEVDADNADSYRANADLYRAELSELHTYVLQHALPKFRLNDSASSSPPTMLSTISAVRTGLRCAGCRASAPQLKPALPMYADWPI